MKKMMIAYIMAIASLSALADDPWTDPATGITWIYRTLSPDQISIGYLANVVAISPSTEGDLVIPQKINGKKVVQIDSHAFLGCRSITSVIIPDGVRIIGEKAFASCSSLVSVTLPSSVEFIGQQAFEWCVELDSLHIDDLSAWCNIERGGGGLLLENDINLYVNGEKVVNLVIPDGVENIKSRAFDRVADLKTVLIPSSVTSIGYRAFRCEDLEFVCFEGNAPANDGLIYGETYADRVTTWVREGSRGWGEVPGKWCERPIESWSDYPIVPWIDKTAEIDGIKWQYYVHNGNAVVLRCEEAKDSVVIPETLGGYAVAAVADNAFAGSSKVFSLSIPESVTRIGKNAFSDCSALTSISLPKGVTRICDGTFSGCRALQSAAIPTGVTYIGKDAFFGCSSLESISLPTGLISICDRAFSRSGLTSIQIPNSVRTIGSEAFCFCRLSSVTIPASVTRIGTSAFNGNNLEDVHVDDLWAFGKIDFGDRTANPLYSNAKLYANGKLVEETVKVTFRLGDEYGMIAMFSDEKSEWGFSNEKTIEIGIGRPIWPPEADVLDRRFEIRSWDAGSWDDNFCCVMRDVTAHPIYGGAEIHAAMNWQSVDLQCCLIDRVVYDVSSGCIRAQGTVNTESSPLSGLDLDDMYQYETLGESAYENLRICLIGRDEYGDRVCHADLQRSYPISGSGFTWSGALPIDTNKVRQIDVALVSTWYEGEYCLHQISVEGIGCRKLVVRKMDLLDLLNADYRFVGAGRPYSGSVWRYYEYQRELVGEKCETVYEFSDREGRANADTSVMFNGVGVDLSRGSFSWMTDYESTKHVTNIVDLCQFRWYGNNGNERYTYSTEISVPPIKYSVRFDLGDCGMRVGGGELVQEINSGKEESEEMPIVEALPHCSFLRWRQSHWESGTLVYVAEYDREYVITYQGVKAAENPNPLTYTETNEVVFAALADTAEWKFDGWSPAKIDVGTTGDVTVTALWRPIEKAEIVGGWSEPQAFEYDGQVHGVDYSARLDVMDWPLNVVTQGTIRAVNVGEYAATARAETVGVPETDTVYYRCAAITNDCRWTITPKPVTKLQITYVSTAMIANGQPQTPQIVVRDVERDVVLTADDYTLAYENNVEPGKGIARITGKGNCGGETTIGFPIVAGVSPSEGLNMDDDTFEIVGETDWVADNVETHDGYASMRSGAIADGETSVLKSVVHGAGTVSFWWKVSSQRFDSVLELDRLEFYIDGERQKWINGGTPWAKLSYKVDGAGPHELKWVYVKDGSVSERQDCGWVDEVSWEKDWLIGDWLNDVDREFMTDEGDSLVKWLPDSSVSADGVGSMRSGACQQGQRSVLSTVVENAGELTFKWKSSCVAYGDYVTDKLSLLVDGVPVEDKDGKDIFVNGQTDWRDVSCRISGVGRHEVQWVFEKVSDEPAGKNCGWVDVVRWNGEPGTLTEDDLVIDAFDGIYDGQEHGVLVSVKGAQGASVKYGASSDAIVNAASPTFADCGEHEVWFAVNVPEFYEYVGKTVVRIQPRSIETGVVTLGAPLGYTGAVHTQTVSSVIVDGLAATFEVSDNEAREAGEYQLTVAGTGNFCGTLTVSFAVDKATASLKDVTVEGVPSDLGAVEFTYDGKAHLPKVIAAYDPSATVRFALEEDGPYADALDVSNVVERLDVWYEITSANFARLVGKTRMTIRPLSIAGAEVVLGEQVSDAEGHVVQLVDSVVVGGLSATFDVADNVAVAEGDFELTVSGTGNFTGEAKCPYSVGGIVLPPVMTPGDGTIFTNAQQVRFSVQTQGSKCYYTLDGSMPTTNSLTASRVNLHGKTTIRAMAVLDGKLRSAVVEAHYALGACEAPKIRLVGRDGFVFHFPGQQVVIDWEGEEGVVRYTLDGSEPTSESPAYEGPFDISETTTVKAKAFSDSYFDSETVTADLRLEVLSAPTPVIEAKSEYVGTRTTVSMSCALAGAVVRYTLDGSEPTATSGLYEKPFEIGGKLGSSIPVKARAFCEHYADSPVAEAVVTRVWGVGDALGVPDMTFETDGWVVDPLETFGGLESMRSGPTGDGETKALETVVQGGGTISFSWRTSCEDSDGDFIWDRAEFWVDDECVARREGETGWQSVSHEIPVGDGSHRLRWLYVKDPEPETSEGEDCAWLAALSWLPDDEAQTELVVYDPNGKIVLPSGKGVSEVKIRVMSNGHDIFPYLRLPAAVNGVVDLSQATVKDEIVKEVLDPKKGAVVDLSGGPLGTTGPTITTAPTRVGLVYTFREGTTLEGLGAKSPSATKVGDGEKWTPEISVKGGDAAFYSIGVGKGE